MVLVVKRQELPYIVEQIFILNCSKEYFIIFLPNKRLKIGQILNKPENSIISKELQIKVDLTITIHFHKECLGKFIRHLLKSVKAFINYPDQTLNEILCDGEVRLCTQENSFTIEKKTTTNEFSLILEISNVHDLKKLLKILQSHILFPLWPNPEDKVQIERFVAKCIESKNTNDITSVFNSLEVKSVLEDLGKDSNILHKHFLYFQISQNLEFLQLFINLIPFNEKKKNQKQRLAQRKLKQDKI